GIVLMVSFIVPAAFAQRITGSISGTVVDPQGAVISGAKVTVTNEAMGVALSTASSTQGNFEVQNLKPGEYKVKVEAGGFAPYTAKVPVKVGVNTPVVAKVNVGTETSAVDVNAEAVTVDTTQATVQGVITADRIQQI